MNPWFGSRRTQVLIAVALPCTECASTLFVGVDLLPGFVVETGVLLRWGIGHCDNRAIARTWTDNSRD